MSFEGRSRGCEGGRHPGCGGLARWGRGAGGSFPGCTLGPTLPQPLPGRPLPNQIGPRAWWAEARGLVPGPLYPWAARPIKVTHFT